MRSAAEFRRAVAGAPGARLDGIAIIDWADGPVRSALARVEDGNAAWRYLVSLSKQDLTTDDAPELRELAEKFRAAYRESLLVAMALHRWVQLHVRFEREKPETFRSPKVTIKWGFGDCDDSARLLVVLYRFAGFRAELARLNRPNGQPKHAVARVFVHGAWWWAETTVPARFGEHPLDAVKRLGLARARADIGGGKMTDAGPQDIGGVTDEGGQLVFDPGVYGLRVLVDSSFAQADVEDMIGDMGGFGAPIHASTSPLPGGPAFATPAPELPGQTLWYVQATVTITVAVNRVDQGAFPVTFVDASAWPPPDPSVMPTDPKRRRFWNKAAAVVEAWKELAAKQPARFSPAVPTVHQVALVLAVAEGETACGDVWGRSHNWGALQKRKVSDQESAELHGYDPAACVRSGGAGAPSFLNGWDGPSPPANFTLGGKPWGGNRWAGAGYRQLHCDSMTGDAATGYWVFFFAFKTDPEGAYAQLNQALVGKFVTSDLLASASTDDLAVAMKHQGYYGVAIGTYQAMLRRTFASIMPALAGWDPNVAPHDPWEEWHPSPGQEGSPSGGGGVAGVVAAGVAFVVALGSAVWGAVSR